MSFKKKAPAPTVAQPPTPEPIYSLGQAATVLNLEERAVARKLTTGEIVGVKKHGRWYTSHKHLLNYLGL